MATTAAAVGPGAARGARGGMALGRGTGVLNVIRNELVNYKENTKMREVPQNHGLICKILWFPMLLRQLRLK